MTRVSTLRYDLTGQRFGRLAVLRQVPMTGEHTRAWQCRCDCGIVVVVVSSSLRAGKTRSCGCLRKDIATGRALPSTFCRWEKP